MVDYRYDLKELKEFVNKEYDVSILINLMRDPETRYVFGMKAADALEAQAKEIAELKKENERLKLFRPYRTELTDCLKTMNVGDKACFPAGDEYEKRRKSILRLAKLAGVKVKTRHVIKENFDQISVERVG